MSNDDAYAADDYDEAADDGDDRRSHPVLVPLLIILAVLVVLAIVARFAWHTLTQPLPSVPTPTIAPSMPVTPASATPSEAPSGTPTDNRMPIRRIQVGVCFEQKATVDSQTTYIWPIDCSQPHDSEVFYAAAMPNGPYPDKDGWQANVDKYCHPAFQHYVGIDYAHSRLSVFRVNPPEDVWTGGDRILVCYAVDPDGDRTSSVKNTKK